jgi:hypothetical protein
MSSHKNFLSYFLLTVLSAYTASTHTMETGISLNQEIPLKNKTGSNNKEQVQAYMPKSRSLWWRFLPWKRYNPATEYIEYTFGPYAKISEKDERYFAKKKIQAIYADAKNARHIFQRLISYKPVDANDEYIRQIAAIAVNKFDKEYREYKEIYDLSVHSLDAASIRYAKPYKQYDDGNYPITIRLNTRGEISQSGRTNTVDEFTIETEFNVATQNQDHEGNMIYDPIQFNNDEIEKLLSILTVGINAVKCSYKEKYHQKNSPDIYKEIKDQIDRSEKESKEELEKKKKEWLIKGKKNNVVYNSNDLNDLSDSWIAVGDKGEKSDQIQYVNSLDEMNKTILSESQAQPKITSNDVHNYYYNGTEYSTGINDLSAEIAGLTKEKENTNKLWFRKRINLQNLIDKKTKLRNALAQDYMRITEISPNYTFVQAEL